MNVLKGHYNLAQGKRPDSYRESVALGSRTSAKIVRETTLIKGFHYFGRKGMNSNSVRKEFFALIIVFARTVFYLFLLPRRCLGLVYAGLAGRNLCMRRPKFACKTTTTEFYLTN
jgi:hypothetical protein